MKKLIFILTLLLSPTALAEKDISTNALLGNPGGFMLTVDQVLDPLAPELEKLGKVYSGDQFKQRAAAVIFPHLERVVFGKLLLRDAWNSVSPQERLSYRHSQADTQRAELVRKYGVGSPTKADEVLREKTGKGLDATVAKIMDTVATNKFLKKKLDHRTDVSRRDIHRYYDDNKDEWSHSSKRVLRMIRVDLNERLVADYINNQLDSGVPFKQVATHPLNKYNNQNGGIMSGEQQGDVIFAHPFVNKMAVAQAEGTWAFRKIKSKKSEGYWWVYIEQLTPAKVDSVYDVQQIIEQRIKKVRYETAFEKYYKDVMGRNNIDFESMSKTLLDMASNKFDR